MEKIGGRKFGLVVVVFLITSLLTYFKIISEDIYSNVVFLIISGYIIGNVTQKVLTVDNKKDEVK